MTSAPPLHAAVAHAIRLATAPHQQQTSSWLRSFKQGEPEKSCVFCLADLSEPEATAFNSLLVPPFLGGTVIDPNRIRTCRSCARLRDNHDVLGWRRFHQLGTPDSRARVLALREEVLTASANHLTQTRANAPKRLVLDALRKRWSHPRIKVYAFHGTDGAFIGWTPRCGGRAALGEIAGILRFGFQSLPTPDHRLTLFQVPPNRFFDAVWALIGHGALVEPIRLDGYPTPLMDRENWKAWWSITFTDPLDLARRRPRKTGNSSRVPGTLAHSAKVARAKLKAAGIKEMPELVSTQSMIQAPRKPRPLSQSSSAICHRKRYREEVKLQRERQWLAARDALHDFKQRVRDGRVQRPTIEEEIAMEHQVMNLFDLIHKWDE